MQVPDSLGDFALFTNTEPRQFRIDAISAQGSGREVPHGGELVLDADVSESRARRTLVRAASGFDHFSELCALINQVLDQQNEKAPESEKQQQAA